MASGFFALFDDIATLMDDVATMGKVAAKKTTSILGDDLAVKSNQASGFVSDREIPVILKILKGSLINKLIILPIAFLLSIYLPQAITVLLLLGGAYLGYEGFEKIFEWIFHKEDKEAKKQLLSKTKPQDFLAYENTKIKSAIRTDFVLSLEVIIVALGMVKDTPIFSRIVIVTLIAIGATIGVYAIVALIVRLDDIGYKIKHFSSNKLLNKIGNILINSLPYVIRALMIIGTLAMLTVAGGIYLHSTPYFHHFFEKIPSILSELVLGFVIGGVAFVFISGVQQILKLFKK